MNTTRNQNSLLIPSLAFYRGNLKITTQLSQTNHTYFSTTAQIGNHTAGCLHKEILEVAPELAPLIALHLSGLDGVPMHAEANGWYWLSGSFGGCGDRYHGSYLSDRTPDNCLQLFAEHCRISLKEAQMIQDIFVHLPDSVKKETWGLVCHNMRPRWSKEATAGIDLLNEMIVEHKKNFLVKF